MFVNHSGIGNINNEFGYPIENVWFTGSHDCDIIWLSIRLTTSLRDKGIFQILVLHTQLEIYVFI